MHNSQGKFFAVLVAGFMLISILPYYSSISQTTLDNAQKSKQGSSIQAPSASQHNLSTPYIYTLNEIKTSITYNESFDRARSLQVYGEYLFYMLGDTYLGVHNISNPEDPQYLGHFNFVNPIVHFQPNGTFMFVATSNSLIQMDISNPLNMQMVGFFASFEGDILTFLVVDSTLYLLIKVGTTTWLQIFTNYNWHGVNYISNYSLGAQTHPKIIYNQDKLLIGTFEGNIHLFLVSNPANPVYVNQTNIGINIISMKMFGNYLIAVNLDNVFIMNPDSLAVIQSLPIRQIMGYSIQGNLGYFASNLGPLYIINMTDLNRMNCIARLECGSFLYGFEDHGNIMFVSSETNLYGIKVARMLEAPLTQYSFSGLTISKVRVFGYYAYICTYDDIKIFDLRNNQIAGSYSHAGQAVRDCYQNGYLLYVLFEDSVIRIINILDPYNPYYVNEFSTGLSNAWALRASGQYLFACFLQSGVQIIDISNPTSLSNVATIGNEPGSFAYDCAIVGDHLYIANYNAICVYDITTINMPMNIVNISITYAFSMDVSYPFLFVGTMIGYTAYDISHGNPALIMGFDTGGSNTMCIKRSGEYLLLGAAGSGVKIAIVKSADAIEMKYNNMSGSIYGLDAFYDKMILSKDTDGFSVSKIRETALDFSDGVPFLERFWVNRTLNETIPTDKPGDEQNNPSPFDWNSLLTYGGPPLAIVAIIYVIVKSKRKGGPKAKKIKAMTKEKIEKGVSSNQDDFFDSDF